MIEKEAQEGGRERRAGNGRRGAKRRMRKRRNRKEEKDEEGDGEKRSIHGWQ